MMFQKRQKKLIIALVLLLLCGGIGSAFFFFFNFPLFWTSQAQLPLQMITYQDLRVGLRLEKIAKVVPMQEITVASELNARIKRLLVQEGQLVKGGQPLAILDDDSQKYALQVEYAKKQLDQALQAKEQANLLAEEQLKGAEQHYQQSQAKFSEIQLLLEQAITAENADYVAQIQEKLLIAEQNLKSAKLDYEQFRSREQWRKSEIDLLILNAKNSYESALKEYANLTIRSPMTAKIANFLLSEGDLIAKGTPILQLKTEQVQAEFLLSADEYVAIDEKAELTFAKDHQQFTGKIENIQPSDSQINQFKAKIWLPQEYFQEGQIFKIELPFAIGQAIFPLEHLRLLSLEEGEIPFLSWDKHSFQKVKIQKLIWSFVKLKSPIPSDFSLLLMDFSQENKKILEQWAN